MNDFRAQAYLNNQKKNNSENNSSNEKKIKSVSWTKISKEDAEKNNLNISSVKPTKEDKEGVKLHLSSAAKKAADGNEGFEKIIKNTKKSDDQRLEKATEFLKTGGLVKVPVENPSPDGSDSVYRRVAKFLLLIGEDEAAKILPHLSEAQIEKIIPEIASIRTVDKDEAEVILAEFNSLLNSSRESGGIETAREMLVKAYGEERADEMLEKAVPNKGVKPFEYLNDADSERVYMLLKDENVGVQTLVLSHLDPKKAAAVINQMNPEEKKEVVMRLAKMEPVSPEVVRRVDEGMHEKSLKQTSEKAENVDGRNALAQILKKMDVGAEQDIITYLSNDDPDLGQDIRSRLFTMDDVIEADDRFVQKKLQEMKESDIAYLIAGKPDNFRDKILNNISAGRKAEVLDQEEILKPMRRSDCEKITSQFFSILRREYEAGHLIIKSRNDDVFI